jgi:hypothetical protein
MRTLPSIIALSLFSCVSASAQQVDVKYRDGPVDLKHFACTKTVSSFVNEVCYDRKNQYMVIQLKETRYPYCDIDAETVASLLSADSKGRYYNASIKGKFGCQGKTQPKY